MLNVTVVAPTHAGYLTVFPFATTAPLASNLNYAVGATVGNEIAAKMTIGNATDDFSVFAFGTTHVVIDVVGYFMAPQTTALQTITANHLDTLAAGQILTVNVACPVGYALTGSGCFTSSNDGRTVIYGSGIASGIQYCQYHNISGGDETGSYAQCARVPGR